MPEDDKTEETAEDKIATSAGNETEVMAQTLEDEADQLIKDAYGGDDKDGKGNDDTSGVGKDDKDANKADKDDEANDNKGGSQDTDEDNNEDGEKDEVKRLDPEIVALLGKLEKSEKRVSDTRADHTRGRQELKEANTKSLELEDTVFKLKTQVEELTKASTAKQEQKTEKAVAKTTGVLEDQIAAMEKIDPDLAATMKPIVEGMFGQINDLKADLATEKQEAKNKKIQDDNDTHFLKLDTAHDGWEATMQTEEFGQFLQGMAPRAKRLALLDLKGGTAENIIEIFDEFKDSQGSDDNDVDTKKSDKLEKAKSLSNPTNKKSKNIDTGTKKMLYTRSQINAMTNEEYAKEEDAIDKAMAAGQIAQR